MEKSLKFHKLPIDRFFSFVEKSGNCWIWCGSRVRGYGRIAMNGRPAWAHRVSFSMFVGPSNGLDICHRCDNPACVNPKHLFAATHAENMADMRSKGRYIGKKCEQNPAAKLRKNQVLKIRKLFLAGASKRQLSISFSVSRPTIARIVNNKGWLFGASQKTGPSLSQ